ncbi:protein phosphatase 2C domain-containing protein [Leptolyngbya sp. DQ-M1]|uniref:PP2C family protein-serine/threonine phosphatase n=1 Tax=Leptolyngbya sp. DQ-M1 TaxID=2933920 RepID=UPI003299F2F8
MQTDSIVQCPNCFCQALNSESQPFCHNCHTRIPKRYLWALGSTASPGELIDDRFLIKSGQIALDTKPGLPTSAIEVPPPLEPYLHLMTERPAIPQPYAVVGEIVFLESAPLYPSGARSEQGEDLSGQLMPRLEQVWNASRGFRQLHFLRQLAQLWRSLSVEKAASTLLNSDLIFADGDTVRVLELELDRGTVPLAELGKFWSSWQVQPAIAEFLNQVCQNLIQGQITNAEGLIEVLDAAIASQSTQQTRQIQLATLSDQGPSRSSNEDACYPVSGTSGANHSLLIVCDGVGGHEGGEVASNLAIQTIVQHTQTLTQNLEWGLEEAVLRANDAIAAKNDAERRQERQRMGTTVVMGLVRSHELYLTHVGDSRAYRITRRGCYQVTLDDDVASRQARSGYTLYREAVQRSSAGSLVQALGMGSSNTLHPSTQRFILDEDCVFLLCSDGLSDNDLVEEYWQSEIVPMLDGKTDLATVARRLVEIANTQNGHDNVTVGLIHCQIRETGQSSTVQLSELPERTKPTQMFAPSTSPPGLRTELQPRRSSWLKTLLMLLGLFSVAGAIAALFVPELIPTLSNRRPTVVESPLVPPVPDPPRALDTGALIRLDRPASDVGLPLLRTSGSPVDPARELVGQIPPGTVLQVLGRQQNTTDRSTWIRLKVCTPNPDAKLPNAVKAGDIGLQKESAIAPFSIADSNQLGVCTASTELPKPNVPSTP